MIPANRTRSVLSTLAIISVLLLCQTGPGLAQADKFQEDMQKGETALNQRNYEASVSHKKTQLDPA
jgi:hypothetical protein